MVNPWNHIALSSYEKHMGSENVAQLQAISAITKEQLTCGNEIVAVLGAAGGNGLEHIDPAVTKKVYAVDLNPDYLEACRERHSRLEGILETVLRDLADPAAALPGCDLLICNLIVEYLGLDVFQGLIARGRENLKIVSCVVQQNNGVGFVGVSDTAMDLQSLDSLHRDIHPDDLERSLTGIGLTVIGRRCYPLPGGKEFVRIDFAV